MRKQTMTIELDERANESEAWLEQAESLYLAAEVLGFELTAQLAKPTPSADRRIRVLGLVRVVGH